MYSVRKVTVERCCVCVLLLFGCLISTKERKNKTWVV